MSKDTAIEWADSSLNLMMGCDGCELWNPANGVKHCYAGTLTDRYAGHSTGYPESFGRPKLFLERLKPALKWSDLTGTDRPDKPWLNGMPRVVFLNDMGDTFTESLPVDWMAPLLPAMAGSPHTWLLLTKRARRMREFSEKHALPANVWPGVSVTTQGTTRRIEELLKIRSGGTKWVSAEPLLGPVDMVQRFNDGATRNFLTGQFHGMKCKGVNGHPDFTVETAEGSLPRIGWLIPGGESGPDSRPCDIAWIRSLAYQCQAAGTACFVKQLGSKVTVPYYDDDYRDWALDRDHTVECPVHGEHFASDAWQPSPGAKIEVYFKRDKGGSPEEWPESLRIREFPKVEVMA